MLCIQPPTPSPMIETSKQGVFLGCFLGVLPRPLWGCYASTLPNIPHPTSIILRFSRLELAPRSGDPFPRGCVWPVQLPKVAMHHVTSVLLEGKSVNTWPKLRKGPLSSFNTGCVVAQRCLCLFSGQKQPQWPGALSSDADTSPQSSPV